MAENSRPGARQQGARHTEPRQPEPEDHNVIDLASAKRRLRFVAVAADSGSDADALLRALKDVASVRALRPRKPLPLLVPPAVPMRFSVHVDVVGATLPIWRRLSVPSNVTLDRMHDVLQVAFGWADSHLHQFTLAADPYGQETEGILTPFAADEGDHGVLESELRLDQFLARRGDSLRYTYDFGDDWELILTLEAAEMTAGDGVADASIRCVAGRRKGPREDSGGIYDYEHILAVAANPHGPEYRELIEEIADLDLFDFTDTIDMGAINRDLARL